MSLQYLIEATLAEVTNLYPTDINEWHEIILKKAVRIRSSTTPNVYVVYLQESLFASFSKAIKSDEFDKYINAMKGELNLMVQNNIS